MTKAYVLRTTKKDGKAHSDFRWPLEIGATVTAPDWNPKAECGGGLHGLLDGIGNYSLLSNEADALWWVVEVDREKCVWIDQGKVKFESCTIVYFGDMARAMTMVSNAWIKLALAEKPDGDRVQSASRHSSQLAASWHSSNLAASGYSSQLAASGHSSQLAASGHSSRLAASGHSSQLAASGYSSQLAASGHSSQLAASGYSSNLAASGDSSRLAASGDSSRLAASGHYSRLAASGDSSRLAASGHYSRLAASGDSSRLAASGDYSRLAASGDKSIAVAAALNCFASVGKGGCIALTYWDEKADRYRVVVGYEGENIKAGVVYTVIDGNLVEAE